MCYIRYLHLYSMFYNGREIVKKKVLKFLLIIVLVINTCNSSSKKLPKKFLGTTMSIWKISDNLFLI